MKQYHIVNNSVVILAESHNPTVLSEGFLITSKIISDYEEVNSGSIIISPPFSKVNFTNGTKMIIELHRMKIESKEGIDPFKKAEKYLNALPHIKCVAIGFNYNYQISSSSLIDWFDKFNYGKLIANGIKFVYVHEKIEVNVVVSKSNDNIGNVEFNFHYKFNKEPFGNIKFDFGKKYIDNKDIANSIINELMN